MGLNETLSIFRGFWCPNCGERRDDSTRRKGMCCSRKDRQGCLSSEPGTRSHDCSVSDTKLLLSIEQWSIVQFGYVKRVLDCALYWQMPISYKHHRHLPNLFLSHRYCLSALTMISKRTVFYQKWKIQRLVWRADLLYGKSSGHRKDSMHYFQLVGDVTYIYSH